MPTDLLPDAFSEAARLLAEGLEPAFAWEVLRDHCSPQCLLAYGEGEDIRCSCRCRERGFGTMLHGYFRNFRVDCVARTPRLEAPPDTTTPSLLDEHLQPHSDALPEAHSA